MVNKKENTTMIISKDLRNNLAILKSNYQLNDLCQVAQLLYNIRDETMLREDVDKVKELKTKELLDERKQMLSTLIDKYEFESEIVNSLSNKELSDTIKRVEENKDYLELIKSTKINKESSGNQSTDPDTKK